MDSVTLDRKLRSVGKDAFVEHFDLFKDYAARKISHESAIETLMRVNRSNEAGASIRLGNAKAIFAAGRQLEALMMIKQSDRLPEETVRSAHRIYERECD